MNVAMLFDSRIGSDGGNYWIRIRNFLFQNEVIRKSKRYVKISIGDIFSKYWQKIEAEHFINKILGPSEWNSINEVKFINSYNNSIIFCVLIENSNKKMIVDLEEHLINDPSFIGSISVLWDDPVHYKLFAGKLIEKYRAKANECLIFIPMGNPEGVDLHEPEDLKALGFVNVDYEDRGIHKTFYDTSTNIEHYKRVSNFRRSVEPFISGGEDSAFDLTSHLHDLNPKLFKALSALVDRLNQHPTEEEVAQAALSGRRYMEQLADSLFPAQAAKRNNRSLGKEAFKNRIWAYIEDNSAGDKNLLMALGKENDNIFDYFNKGLHATTTKEEIMKNIVRAADLTVRLIELSPRSFLRPYYG